MAALKGRVEKILPPYSLCVVKGDYKGGRERVRQPLCMVSYYETRCKEEGEIKLS